MKRFFTSDKLKLEIIDALSSLKGKARFNEIKKQIDERRRRLYREIPIKRYRPKRISTSTLAVKLRELEKDRTINVVRVSKNNVLYMLRSARLSDTEYMLGEVIVSLACVLRLLGVPSPLTMAIRAVTDMMPRDIGLILKFLKKLEKTSAKARASIKKYLESQT
jgi:DNA-binding HxlR family transcriptional regulator